jgi:hypothetical protein
MTATLSAPIIVDLGKTKRKKVKQLKKGRGSLLDDVQDALQEVATSLGEQASGKQLVPVVLLYQRKRKGRARGGGILPGLF